MAKTIRLSEACDGRGKNLDAAARGFERCAERILAESSEPPTIIRLLWQLETIARPELREARRRQAQLREAGTRRLIESFQPLADAAPLREGLAGAEALREVGKNRVIVPRLLVGCRNCMHGHQEGIVRAPTNILALQRHGAGED